MKGKISALYNIYTLQHLHLQYLQSTTLHSTIYILHSTIVDMYSYALVKKLFAPMLDNVSKELLEAIRKVDIQVTFIPTTEKLFSIVPKVKGSNNWAVSANRSTSGIIH
jgi:acyl-homoserine lactone acylase PvdQ